MQERIIVTPDKPDWRLTNQQKYLQGVAIWWKKYSRYSQSWDHDHCAFCWATFSECEGTQYGYATEGNYHWICNQCFEDFKDLFDWHVIDAKPKPTI